MFSKPVAFFNFGDRVTVGQSKKRFALALAAIFLAPMSASFAAVWPGYQFLTISNSSGAGNTAFTQFSGANGVINVSHSFSTGGAGGADNNNALISPSQFTNTFPGTGQVQGHLAQTVYNHTSVVTFDLTNYLITPDTAFGMWNTTDEVSPPPGGNPVYRVQLIINNNQVNPSSFFLMGKQDNQTQVQGRHELDMALNGDITPGVTINGGIGTHTSATFWKNIPTNTQKIIVYGDLPPLNNIGDGVGYYFAELLPEPSSILFSIIGLGLLTFSRRRRR
jgi:hypothetical protein